MKEAGFIKSSSFALISQIVSISVGVISTFLLPKLLTISDFGYYQLFLLYASYVGLAHFGFCDGMYLSLGGKRFEEVDKKEWGAKYLIVVGHLLLLCLLISLYSVLMLSNEYQNIGLYVGFYLFVENVFILLGFHLIATAHVIVYSRAIMISKLLFLVFVLLCIAFLPLRSFNAVSIAYITTHGVAALYIFSKFRGFFHLNYLLNQNRYLLMKSVIVCVIVGFPLVLSNLAANFILGSGRLFIQDGWNIEVFAKVSFALTISFFVLTFISQISYVLFPFLRRSDAEQQRFLLNDFVNVFGLLVMACLVLYIPLSYVIKQWLPNYEMSISYLFMLFPITYFEVKNKLIFDTFFKSLLKQKALLIINVLALALAIILYFLFRTIMLLDAIVISMVFSIFLKSILMQFYLYRKYGMAQNFSSILLEPMLLAIAVITFYFWGLAGITFCYFALMMPYFIVRRNVFIHSVRHIKNQLI